VNSNKGKKVKSMAKRYLHNKGKSSTVKGINRCDLLLTAMLGLLFSSVVYACPLCTIAVGAGLSLSHWLGVDDTYSGLWIGAFMMSLIFWTVHWLDHKQIRFKGRKLLIFSLFYFLLFAPLYKKDVIGSNPLNTLWGIDKLLLGIIVGSIAFTGGHLWYHHIKAQRGGYAQFPFQKIVMALLPVLGLTLIFYLII
jgi:hypothetical protein